MDDALQQRVGTGRLGVLSPALDAPRRFLKFISTTPGLMTVISGLMVLAIIAAGGAMAAQSANQQGDLNTLVNRTEPVSFAAQELYNSLSVADSVATTGFVEDATGPVDYEPSYREALDTASRAVVRAAAGIDDPSSREMELILEIQEKLPIYTSLITEAGVNNRQGMPIGGAYITQASSMMQDDLLPAAGELHASTSSEVGRQQLALTQPNWFALSGLVAAVVLLIIAQFYLAAQTNRRVNPGYLAATVLMTIAMLWAGGAALNTWTSGARGLDGTTQPLEVLTSLRIEVQQTRTSEALSLVQRDYNDVTQSSFSEQVASIDADLEQLRPSISDSDAVDDARENLRGWDNAHADMVSLVRQGDYAAAIRATVGDSPTVSNDGSGTSAEPTVTESYQALDENLRTLIDDTREQLREYLSDSRAAAQQVTSIVILLGLVSALCVIQGIRPRLQEYL
ncbi:MAG TPA: hypothetical protein H9870_09930 [Candidatus Corynebacterium avicola]|uniref:Chemotaxis methyl-accepting receptor HlyB-like 4HB MCP domain-containing protein n=1 Tax=Candidatus Corynebacterium avicola TaxID=2838527 RepID=A0A9D1UML5_9CORY|nr:hypothetical protein [Candidatus Corynebacterium avicola]